MSILSSLTLTVTLFAAISNYVIFIFNLPQCLKIYIKDYLMPNCGGKRVSTVATVGNLRCRPLLWSCIYKIMIIFTSITCFTVWTQSPPSFADWHTSASFICIINKKLATTGQGTQHNGGMGPSNAVLTTWVLLPITIKYNMYSCHQETVTRHSQLIWLFSSLWKHYFIISCFIINSFYLIF